ncbi:hypothetical protein DCAR_0522373 [Daucus carota subsp. sativus]|uniref:Protein kinase domain-containing protein n=1 Tax=Daucus carota subsp. sativus TaxID=79200 RepID=A0AAF0X841_DAUCS|nr:PREDICTED: probable serine/threonine-protein kinase At1g54610 [Daucus carota subsp. sativus]WOH02983.1 hypothetical protein DCAR_0522373 [Daucus carota subsp. sativus]
MGNCCRSFAREVDSERQGSTSVPVHASNDGRGESQRAFRGLHPGSGRVLRGSEAELVAAGWPSWMVQDVGEAFRGWVPRKEHSFHIIEKIGEGAYSTVYRALDIEKRRIVALKKIKLNNLEAGSIRFMAREINILRRLNHPNIIKLEGLIASERSRNFFLVLEYMEHDLAGLASRPGLKFTEPQIKCFMKQLLCGLHHCHSQGILHRDIKGSNLLLDHNGQLKIADFGLANYYDPEQYRPLTNRVVTLWYRPPELLLGATSYGTAVDMWSAGCILAELYAGQPIFPGETEVDQLHRIFTLCGSPSEDYWSLLNLPPADIYNPQTRLRRRVAEYFSGLSAPALALIETLLSLEPSARRSARHALNSDFFWSEPLPCKPEELPKYPPSKEQHAIARYEEARRQAAGGSEGDTYDFKGKGTMDNQFVSALNINAALYRSMLRRRTQDNPEAGSPSPIELPRPEEISGTSHSGAWAQNNNYASAQIVSNARQHPAYDRVPRQNDSRHQQSTAFYANEEVRNSYRDPVRPGYEYGASSSSSRIYYSRPLPPPVRRPDEIPRPHPTLASNAEEMPSRRLPAPAGRPDPRIPRPPRAPVRRT